MKWKGILMSIPTMNMLPMVPRVVRFQYNPTTIKRSVSARFQKGSGSEDDVQGFKGAPTESIDLEIKIESIDRKFAILGVRPQIAMLQLMAYPSLKQVVANKLLKKDKKVKIDPYEVPMTIFTFGTHVIPVRVRSVNIQEEFYDTSLNPIHATLSLGLDLPTEYDTYLLAYQGQLEVLAAAAIAQEVAEAAAAAASAISARL